MRKILLIPVKLIFWIIQNIKYTLAILLFKICWIDVWKNFKYFWSLFEINTIYFVCSENLHIWNNVFIGARFYCNSYNWVHIWDNVMISHNVAIISANHKVNNYLISRNEHENNNPIFIWEWTWIWYNVVILPGVKIWKNVIIWAMSVVTKDIPDNKVAVWNPAKILNIN